MEVPTAPKGPRKLHGDGILVKRACMHCRRNKAKCSHVRPCTRCTRKGLQCTSDSKSANRARALKGLASFKKRPAELQRVYNRRRRKREYSDESTESESDQSTRSSLFLEQQEPASVVPYHEWTWASPASSAVSVDIGSFKASSAYTVMQEMMSDCDFVYHLTESPNGELNSCFRQSYEAVFGLCYTQSPFVVPIERGSEPHPELALLFWLHAASEYTAAAGKQAMRAYPRLAQLHEVVCSQVDRHVYGDTIMLRGASAPAIEPHSLDPAACGVITITNTGAACPVVLVSPAASLWFGTASADVLAELITAHGAWSWWLQFVSISDWIADLDSWLAHYCAGTKFHTRCQIKGLDGVTRRVVAEATLTMENQQVSNIAWTFAHDQEHRDYL
eukprot:TRINITY_DN6900_c0_g2_i1.p1 TRINITY_DN6900_c0_g2~~TRINITY_DN6900_c0_g2_i1.p1  ORF type:complete len:390 (-),score=22.60 TRINITY_DN6900_c0_g2_i1:43-1212(-)